MHLTFDNEEKDILSDSLKSYMTFLNEMLIFKNLDFKIRIDFYATLLKTSHLLSELDKLNSKNKLEFDLEDILPF